MRSDIGGSLRLPGYRSAPSLYIAFGLGILAAVAYLCRWSPEPPSGMWLNLDPGCYFRMARHPFRPEHLPFVMRPAVPLLVRLIPLPTPWKFAAVNVLFLGLLCALVERIAARLGRPPVVGVAAAAVVCASNPVWKAFYLRAMVDLPVLCLIVGSVLLLLAGRPRGAWIIAATSALAHPLGWLMSAGAVLGRSWAAGITAGLAGAGLSGLYVLLMRSHFLPVADGVAVGFRAALAANEPSPVRALTGALAYGVGPLLIAYLRAPAAYRRIILPATGGVLVALASGSDWTRLLGFLCPLLAPVALPAPLGAPLRARAWREYVWPAAAAAVLAALFLLPTTVSDLTAIRPNKLAGELLFLVSIGLLVPWRLPRRPVMDAPLPA